MYLVYELHNKLIKMFENNALFMDVEVTKSHTASKYIKALLVLKYIVVC